jgi:LacI family transcriptional regulator
MVSCDVVTLLQARRDIRDDDTRRRHVALIVETSLAPGREILRGIARYIREHARWSTFHEPHGLEESVPGWLRNWKGDGIIARIQNAEIAEAVAVTGIPAVDVLGVAQMGRHPLVHTDDARIASLAAEHLLDRGFRHFGFFGIKDEQWSQQRCVAFVNAVRGAGCDAAAYETSRHMLHSRTWDECADELADWVRTLPKPAGIMACSDQCGPLLLEASRRSGAVVPDEVAVIGVDNDEPLCEVADPGLSSVWPDHHRVGYEAAALLDEMMRGTPPPTAPIYVPPKGVVTRQSTDVLAIDDRDIASAVRFIREHACEGPTIDNVADHVSISRSSLQRKFKRIVGRTLHEEMLRMRLSRARELLSESKLPIALIAEKAGFGHQEYMGAVFRQHFGRTPWQYRREQQG